MRNRIGTSSGAKLIGAASFNNNPITDQTLTLNQPPISSDFVSYQQPQVIQGSPLYPDAYAMQQPMYMNQQQPIMYMNQQPPIYGAQVY